jgi:hypothetical protein
MAEEEIEIWDDGDLDIGGDDFTFRSASLATTTTNAPSHHRDSISSRLSIRSDLNSDWGEDERQIHLPADDERTANDAIAAATRAGIPLPQNVPQSALLAGTIKRLGGRKIKKIVDQDDWNDDLELPESSQQLTLKQKDISFFPEALRQVSGDSSVPQSLEKKSNEESLFGLKPRPALKNPVPFSLDQFRDEEDDDDFLGDGMETIKVSKSRMPQPMTLVMPPTPQKKTDDDDFESDFQLPPNDEPLRLSTRKEAPKTPVSLADDFEWGEGSLGTRFGGTRRDARSNRSSSVSVLSPSVASSYTAESEDDGLDGLVLPDDPVDFVQILKKRQETVSPEVRPADKPPTYKKPEPPAPILTPKDDFLTGLEIGDGDVFGPSRRTNKNVKIKTSRIESPARPKALVSLTFTNKPSPPTSRLPRAVGGVHTLLEPVSETGGPIAPRQRRPQSRMGHSSQSSISSIPTPATPSSASSIPPSTPRRRDLMQKTSTATLRNEPTTTNAQLLKVKRSLPVLRGQTQSPAKPAVSRYERPPSRNEGGRPLSMSRPKTPVERDRTGAESSLSHARRNPMPFLPAGASGSQSHHVITKSTSRHFRRHDSESSTQSFDLRPTSRAMSRATMRSPSPVRSRLRGAEALAREAATKRTLIKPKKPRQFGDGNELDAFDDLPTSQTVEQKFTKQPVGRGAPKSSLLRNKIIQNIAPDRTTTPTPSTPFSPAKSNALPRWAQDTNASRIAREQVLSQRAPSISGPPLTTITNQWKAHAARTGLPPLPSSTLKSKKSRPVIQQKPHLIKPMGDLSSNPKTLKGMVYNPITFRWEGNENDLSPFDGASESPSTGSNMPPHLFREKENGTPRPALISNVNSSQNVQVVGNMLFDPQRMCWLKCPPAHRQGPQRGVSGRTESTGGGTMDGFDPFDLDDEEDVFKDVPDLEDKPRARDRDRSPTKGGEDGDSGGEMEGKEKGKGPEGAKGLQDEWLVGEEFDVGPEFVRRQREEEERWRRKCEKWLGAERDGLDDVAWRFRIRDIVNGL